MKSPPDGFQEHQLVLVDLQRVQTGNLAPSTGRIVSVLEVLGGKNQGGQKHASTTLHGPADGLLARLLFGKIWVGHVRLDLDQIIQGHLQSAVARPRTTQGLLDKGAKRQYAFATGSRVTTKRHCRQGPDDLDNLGCGVFVTFSTASNNIPQSIFTHQQGCRQNLLCAPTGASDRAEAGPPGRRWIDSHSCWYAGDVSATPGQRRHRGQVWRYTPATSPGSRSEKASVFRRMSHSHFPRSHQRGL